MDQEISLGSNGLGAAHAMRSEGEGSDSDGGSFDEGLIGVGVSNSETWTL
jgi:hypothetical protein